MKLSRYFAGALAAAAFLFSINIRAQAHGGAPQPLFLRLSVLALDNKGQPVSDLNAADFQVTDQAKIQQASYFHRKGAALAAAAKTAPPGEVSNQATLPPHATVILLDLMSQKSSDGLESFKRVGRSLQQVESGDSVYLYILGMDGVMIPVHPLPPDPLVPAADDKTWTKDIDAQLQKMTKPLFRSRPAGLTQEDVVKKTYVAMETIARQLAFYSGERNILWVMKDVPTVSNPKAPCNGDWLDCALYTQHLTVTLDRAGASLYAVTYANITDPNTNRGMVEFTGMLNGRAFFGDDLRTILGKLAADPAGGYVLGYEVPADKLDNTFHRVKVTCERKGVKIETRQRYYAYPDNRQPVARAQEALMAAMKSPFDDPQIGLRATAAPAEKTAHLQIRIDPADLSLREDGGAFIDHVTTLLVGYTAKGTAGSPVPADYNLRLTKQQHDAVLKDGLSLTQDFPLDGDTQKIRLLIYDHTSGAVGSLSIPLKH